MVDAYIARHHEMERVRTILWKVATIARPSPHLMVELSHQKSEVFQQSKQRVYDLAGVGAGQRLMPTTKP